MGILTVEKDIDEETPFDFRKPTIIGKRINKDNSQLKMDKAYDLNCILNRKISSGIEYTATFYELKSGRIMQVYTIEPDL